MRIRNLCLAAIGLLLPALALADQGAVYVGAQVSEPVTPVDVRVDLRDLPTAPLWRPGMPVMEAHKRQFHAPGKLNTATSPARETAPDRLPELQQLWDSAGERAQRASSGRVTISNGSTGVYPGDPVVDVSPNYIVYGVNGNSTTHTTFTVYDKTGTKLAGPTAMSSLAPSGDGCRTSQSDPIVLFDRLAGRWFLLEMGGTSSAPKMCIYISKSENPVSGGWWFYGFSTPTTNDYPHCGVWNNAYVCSDNEGGSTVTFYAYDRANMLLGNTARGAQRFSSVPSLGGYGFQALTPANFMGDASHAPPAGAPQILARHHDDEAHDGASADPAHDFIDLYALNLDWNTPGNSSISTLPRIQITEFNSWFTDYSTFATVPQPGSTSKLDPIREVIFNTMVYRNLGSYESIVGDFATNQNTARSGSTVDAGIRWFELRKSGGGNWTLYQEGTFSPGDSNTHHLEGSLATDKNGNIGMGYNVTKTSSPVVYASLRYTGRKAADPAGVMTVAETDIATGAAAETSGRWGDYYSTVVDPADDCTFWTVGMYRPSGSWATRIGSFKFDDCGTATTYSISGSVTTSGGAGIAGVTVSSGSASTTTNSSGSYTLANLANGSYTITPSLSGYTFSPASRSVSVSGANVSGQNFTGTAPANNPPTANFSFATNGLSASFTDGSSDSDGSIASRSWNFGDSTSSTATNPSHTYAAAGTYSVTLTVTDNAGATNTKSQSVTVSSGNVLQNGVTVSNLSAATGADLVYTMNVPAGAANLSFTTSGGSGDADLYVKFGAAPTDSVYDCRPYKSGNAESCSFASPSAGTWYVRVKAYSAYSGLSLVGSYGTAPPPNVLQNGVAVTNLSAATNAAVNYTMTVPAGATNLRFVISGGSGDADLYVKFGSAPTTSSYDCRPYLSGNSETCSITTAQAGTYYVMVRAYSAYSGVSLTGSYTP